MPSPFENKTGSQVILPRPVFKTDRTMCLCRCRKSHVCQSWNYKMIEGLAWDRLVTRPSPTEHAWFRMSIHQKLPGSGHTLKIRESAERAIAPFPPGYARGIVRDLRNGNGSSRGGLNRGGGGLFFNSEAGDRPQRRSLWKPWRAKTSERGIVPLLRASTGHRSRVHEHEEHGDRAEIYGVTWKSFHSLSAGRAFRQFMGSRARLA